MNDGLHEKFIDLKCSLNTSLNYYGALWSIGRYWLWMSRAIDFIAAAFAGAAFVMDGASWTRWIAVSIAGLSWLKTESFIDRRVGTLAKQYLQTNRLLSRIPEDAEGETIELYDELRQTLAGVEEGDLPTIQCLMVVCENEMRKKYDMKGRWKLSWWQRHVGVYLRCVRCDSELEFVPEDPEEVSGEMGKRENG